MKKTRAYIISWNGMHESAQSIAQKIIQYVDSIHVIYSNNMDQLETGVGKWVKVDNKDFFGRKFKKCLEIHDCNDHFLLIQADAISEDWQGLILRAKSLQIEKNQIGLWTPEIFDTPWKTRDVEIARDEKRGLSFVAQTDGIVLLINNLVTQRLKSLNYDANNLGWGIDWAAICFSYTNNLKVIRDTIVSIKHIQGSGYLRNEARHQMDIFMDQLTISEKIMFKLLSDKIYLNKSMGIVKS